MAIADPLVAFDLSFALSAGATAGLLAFARPLAGQFEEWAPKRAASVARAAATTVAASIPCMPIVARFAPTMPVGGVIANLLAVPVGECVALPMCLAHAAARLVAPGGTWMRSGRFGRPRSRAIRRSRFCCSGADR